MKAYDVCIIGGGAAGLAAAASFNDGIKICILEKNKKPGKKIMATGGGRCNITNAACENKNMTLDLFKSLGMETHMDPEGRYYPYSNQAADVTKVLTERLEDRHTDIITECQVISVVHRDGRFVATDSMGRVFSADYLLLAAGGKAAPQLGTTGDGYKLAAAFGHRINKVYPILTGICCGDFKDIKGVRAKGTVSLYKDGVLLDKETGEIQFTEEGISGICVMNLTLHITAEDGEPLEQALKRYTLILDLAPDFTEGELMQRKSSFGILSEKLSRRVALDQIKNWTLPVVRVKGWKDAQCTGGGVAMEEVNTDTMESTKIPGLYLAGELLDRQGPCGGFNLQNAWETGIKAAKAINERMGKK